ncbi:hypothetical protein, partial [Roseateles sp. BYS96W]
NLALHGHGDHPSYPCRKMQQGRSVTLVNIQSALHGLSGQFSVGGNTRTFTGEVLPYSQHRLPQKQNPHQFALMGVGFSK